MAICNILYLWIQITGVWEQLKLRQKLTGTETMDSVPYRLSYVNKKLYRYRVTNRKIKCKKT
jgi:hypothetical protein